MGKGYCLPRSGPNYPLETAWTETKWKSPQSFPAHRSLHFPQPCMSLLVVSGWHSPLANTLPCVPQHVPLPPRLQSWGLQVEGDTATPRDQALMKISEGRGSSCGNGSSVSLFVFERKLLTADEQPWPCRRHWAVPDMLKLLVVFYSTRREKWHSLNSCPLSWIS